MSDSCLHRVATRNTNDDANKIADAPGASLEMAQARNEALANIG
jgi:hypothetical protein